MEFSQGGKRRVVRAHREIVLCAGAVNTPQLLMLSGVGDETTSPSTASMLSITRPRSARTCLTISPRPWVLRFTRTAAVTGLERLAHGAVRLGRVRAVVEPALRRQLRDVREGAVEVAALPHLELAEPRRVDEDRAARHDEELTVPRRVPASAVAAEASDLP